MSKPLISVEDLTIRFRTDEGLVTAGEDVSFDINPGEVPVFWACGCTPQAAIMAVKPPFCITHLPGHMFVADPRDADYAVF